MDKKRRSLIKSVTWRILASLTTMILVYAFTQEPGLSLTVGILDAVIKMGIYYGHERVWNRLRFGVEKKT